MKLSTKAILLSAFVFPGTGHLLLKRYRSGFIFVGLCLLLVSCIFIHAVETGPLLAAHISALISNDLIEPTFESIIAAAQKQLPHIQSGLATTLSIVTLIVWAISIFDLYRNKPTLDQS
ncbi:MAG: hypothetical protein JKX83_00110 [Pseudomonadales bacterium]|nr:hypothetical protein [Pseudomonadales bacterium]